MSSNDDPRLPQCSQSDDPGDARATFDSKDQVNPSTSWRRSLVLFLTDEHREFLRWTMVLLVVLLAAEWSWLVLERPDPVLLDRGDTFRNTYRIEINHATWAEWIQLDDVGPSTASRIVADRKVNGPFRSLEDLMRVPGIGKATLEKMRPFLVLQSSEEKTVSSAARD